MNQQCEAISDGPGYEQREDRTILNRASPTIDYLPRSRISIQGFVHIPPPTFDRLACHIPNLLKLLAGSTGIILHGIFGLTERVLRRPNDLVDHAVGLDLFITCNLSGGRFELSSEVLGGAFDPIAVHIRLHS